MILKNKITILVNIVILFIFSVFTLLSNTIDSLEKELNSADEKTKIDIYNQIARQYLEFDIDKSFETVQKSMELATKYNDKIYIADNNYLFAYLYELSNRNANSIKHYQTAIELYRKLNNHGKLAECYNAIGGIYSNLGDYEKALEYYVKAYEIYEDMGDYEGLAISYNNIGIVYKTFGKYELALDNYYRALNLFTIQNDTNKIANVFNNIGLIFYYEKNYDSALSYFNKSVEMLKNDKDKQQSASFLHNIGNVYKNKEQFEDALKYYFLALEIKQNSANKASTCNTLTCIGETYFYLGKSDLAIQYLNKSIELAEIENLREILKNNYIVLSHIFKKQSNYKEAMYYFEKYALINDTIFTKEMSQKIAEFQVSKEIAETNNKLKDMEIEHKNIIMVFVIIGSGFLLILTILLYWFYHKKKTHRILTQKNFELSSINFKLLVSEQNLKASNEIKEQYLTKINSELLSARDYIISLLPEKILKGKIKTDWTFVPSSQLGGDSFGYHWIDDDNFALYLLDVSGHGVSAALHSVAALNSIKFQTLPNTNFNDPANVLSSLNKAFQMLEHNSLFFTIWYGVLNISTRKLVFSSAGHPAPLLLSDGWTKTLECSNLLIGATLEYEYVSKEIILPHSAVIYLFSDGVFEIQYEDEKYTEVNDFYNFLIKNVDNNDIIQTIYDYTKELSIDKQVKDDFSILKIEFQ